MKKVVIEKAKLKDIPEIEKLYKETSIDEHRTQYPNKSKRKILNQIKDSKLRIQRFRKGVQGKKWVLFVAKINNKIIGFSQAHIGMSDTSIGYLDKLYVLKEYRRKGIGEQLTKETNKWLRKKKVKFIEVNVFTKNNPSIKNFEKQGFIKHAYLMRKRY